jgi:hypothetical protein
MKKWFFGMSDDWRVREKAWEILGKSRLLHVKAGYCRRGHPEMRDIESKVHTAEISTEDDRAKRSGRRTRLWGMHEITHQSARCKRDRFVHE